MNEKVKGLGNVLIKKKKKKTNTFTLLIIFIAMFSNLWEYSCNLPKMLQLLGYLLYIKGLEVGNRSRLLRLLNESVIRDTFDEFKAELDQLGCAEDIGKSAPGVYNLLQVACENGLPRHLEAMLKIEGM